MKRFRPLEALLEPGRDADLTAVRRHGEPVSWGAFASRVEGLRRAVAPRSARTWLLACGDALDFAAALLALWAEDRCALVPPNLLPATLELLGGDAEAILGPGGLDPADVPGAEPRPGRLEGGGLVLCTSGSAGEPKRIPKRPGQLGAELALLEGAFGETQEGVLLLGTVPHHHIYGLLFRVLWPLCAGRTWQAEASADPERLGRDLAAAPAVALVASPAHLSRLHRLLDLAPHRGRIRAVFSSGGPLAAGDAEALRRALGEAPFEVYGSTETGGIAWRRRSASETEPPWTPFPGARLELDGSGTLRVRSAATGGALEALPDAVAFQADGRFRLLGRTDRVVKLEEKRVSLPEVEAWLRAHEAVREAAVVVLEGRRASLGAVVVPRDPRADTAPLRAALKTHLARRFDPVALPRRWRFPEALPYDERGKLGVAALRALFEAAP